MVWKTRGGFKRICKFPSVDEATGLRIHKLRIFAGISLGVLADLLNVSERAISAYESGRRRVSAPKLFKIAKYFNVSVASFFEPLGDAK